MHTKKLFESRGLLAGIAFVIALCLGITPNLAGAECSDDDEFTSEFRIQDCGGFNTTGVNPYFILKPGYQLVLETPDGHEEPEKAVITVLNDIKRIRLDGRRIYTRVVEERAFEWDGDEEEWILVEISRNYVAICNRTNDVYYFGEWSRDCEDGFNEDDECEAEESNQGSWEAGKRGARPGIIMPGTFLLGAKYFQEIAERDEAVDRGENVDMGVTVGSWSGCVVVEDTNPAEGICEDGDEKIYCPKIGLVIDEDLELVKYGYVNDDDDAKRRRHRKYHSWH